MIIFALLSLLLLAERVPLIKTKKLFEVDGIKVYLKESDQVNAFVIGRDKLVITSTTLSLPKEEIRAILAHELSHIELGHYKITRLFLFLVVSLGIILGLLNEIPLLVFSYLVLFLLQRFIQRRLELEADKMAVKIVNREVFRSVLLKYGDRTSNVFSTHPSLSARLKL